jgi:hypothetical protein
MSGIIAQNSGRHTGLVKASSGGGGVWNLIETQTASSDSTLDFTSGIDDTYDEYVFKLINIHPATDNVNFTFQADTGTNTSYNQTITSTYFNAFHYENDSSTSLVYETAKDLAQSTSFQMLGRRVGNDNDQQISGTLKIFNPSSSVFVKHFMAIMNEAHYQDNLFNNYIAGYFNTTTALTRFQFKMSSDEIDAGTISLYGIS